MICKTIEAMTKTAKKGAAKMLNEGFSWSKSETEEGVYRIVTAKGTTYRVDPAIGAGYCDCPFHRNNRHFCPLTQCKHILALREEMAREEAYEDYLIDLHDTDRLVQAGLPAPLAMSWPRCEECGSIFDEAIDGGPLDYCGECESRALGAMNRCFR